MSILVINAGSTSLKFALFDPGSLELLLQGGIDWADDDRTHAKLTMKSRAAGEERSRVSVPDNLAAGRCALEHVAQRQRVTMIGHRVVYGGTAFRSSRRIDADVLTTIAGYRALAPLHNPPAVAAIEAAGQVLPGVPQVAVFDTAFFADLPPRAYLYPLPYEWYEKYGVRRIGFHGISHGYCAERAAEMLGRPPTELRLVTCHLGGGCSATAVRGGKPVNTTMGFTPMEGLMMSTRSGSVDPGVLVYLQRECGLSLAELDDALNQRSGLWGVSGGCTFLSQLEAAGRRGDARAQLAFDMFTDRVRSAIGALAVGMGGLDALVFTGGVGEGLPGVRAAICEGLSCLGVSLEAERNRLSQPDADIAADASRGRVLIIATREDLTIARETRGVVGAGA